MKGDRFQRATRRNVRLSLPTVGVLLAVVGGGAFAAGQSVSSDSGASSSSLRRAPAETPAEPAEEVDESTDPLPPGHPPIDSLDQGRDQGRDPAGGQMAAPGMAAPAETSLRWQAPARWQAVENASPMRLATYRVPRVQGDPADPELSITQAGGSVEANAERWIGQFDAAGQKTAKRSTRTVGALEVTIVEVQGTYSAGMGMGRGSSSGSGWALLGAIVSTPGAPHFFKLTGPARSVLASRADFDALVASLAPR